MIVAQKLQDSDSNNNNISAKFQLQSIVFLDTSYLTVLELYNSYGPI